MLKGVAILLILICHMFGYFGNGIVIFTPLGGIGVSMFVFLSAYGLNESWKMTQHTGWWRKRFVTVIIPYAIIQLLMFWSHRQFSFLLFVMDVFLVKPKYIFGWYLNYILLWYLIFYFTMRSKSLKKHKNIVFVIISIVMFFLNSEIRAEQSLSFLAGIIYSECEYKPIRKFLYGWEKGIIMILIGVSFLAFKQTTLIREAHYLIFNFVQLMIKLPIGLGLCVLLSTVFVCKRSLGIASLILNYVKSFFSMLGKASYEIYLLHGYVLYSMPKSHIGVVAFIFLLFLFTFILRRLLMLIKKKCFK